MSSQQNRGRGRGTNTRGGRGSGGGGSGPDQRDDYRQSGGGYRAEQSSGSGRGSGSNRSGGYTQRDEYSGGNRDRAGASGGGDYRRQQRDDNNQTERTGNSSGGRDSGRGGYDRPPFRGQGGGGFRGSGGNRGQGSGGDRGHGGGGDRGHGGGGFRGRGGDRGRGRGRPVSPVRTDVRKIAETVKILKQNNEKGSVGTPVELISNHFKASLKISEFVFHYDIEIKFRRRDGKPSMAKPEPKRVRNEKQIENKSIIDKMCAEWPESGLQTDTYAYDGHKNLFTVEKLKIIGEEEATREVVITLPGFTEQTYEVKIKFARSIPMDAFHTSDKFADVRQVLDIILRDRLQQSLVGVGRNFFSRDPQNTIELEGENCAIGFGHHQSIQKAESGLNVIVDRITTIFRSDGPLIPFIERELGRDINRITFNDFTVRELTSKIRDLKVFTTHILGQKRKYGIESMTNIKPYEHTFETEPGVHKTLEQYFQTKYNITLRHREVPLIKIKGGTRENPKYLPPEICVVYPNQSMPKPLINPEIQRQIVESTNTQNPLKRFEKIQISLEKIVKESKALMDTFGLQISEHPIKLKGRELPQPKIHGNSFKLNQPKELTNCLFLNLSPKVQRDGLQNYFDTFFQRGENNLIKTARDMGMNVKLPQIVGQNLNVSRLEQQMESFDSIIKNVRKNCPSTQILFVCIPDESQLYECIKHLSENIYGVMTQCIKDSLFMRTKPGYFNNFLLKTNAKLNGQNQVLAPRQEMFRPQILTNPSNKTMIIGADVTHPGIHNPLAKERVISSIAAVVGSYDSDFTKFMATVSAVGMNCEYITDFGLMFETLIKGFQKINGKYPQNIVLFRDGVSDSQLNDVLIGEIPQIEAVFKKLKQSKPMITAFVVQKRHHTRFFLTTPSEDRKGNQLFNMKPGTVVDHTVTNPDLDEFHLCSHTGRLGTSRHAKYVVIRNDYKLSKDMLHMLSYSMCFTYCRCATPISIPIPVKYADLAAYRAKQHTAAQNTMFNMGTPSETDAQKREREALNIRKLNETMVVHDNLKFLPYYC